MIVKLDTLGTFITSYINTHKISINELAQEIHVSHGTIDRWIAGDYKKSPQLEALKRLADFTSTELCYIVELIFPSNRIVGEVIPSYVRDQYSKLPDDGKETIKLMLATMTQQHVNKSTHKK